MTSREPPVSRRRESSRPRRICSGVSDLALAAASSIASGMPSSLAHNSAIAGPLLVVSAKFGRARCARSVNSCTASYWANRSMATASSGPGTLRGGTRQVTSPGTPTGPDAGQNRDVRAHGDDLADERRYVVEHVLAVVDHDQHAPDQSLDEPVRFAYSDHGGDCAADRRGVDGCQLDPPRAVGVAVAGLGRHLLGQAGLAPSAGAGDRHQPVRVE